MGWIEFIKRKLCIGILSAVLLALPIVAEAHPSHSDPKSVLRGQKFAQEKCSKCHEVGDEGKSPHPEAVPFRYIARLYDVEHLAEAFAEGIYVGHPDMPTFELAIEDLSDLLNYLTAVQEE